MQSCPYLPLPSRPLTADDIHALGQDRGDRFFLTAMSYAQSLWLDSYPAKALLLVNRALSCALPERSLDAPACGSGGQDEVGVDAVAAPYHAKAWIMHHRPEGRFIGNPRRHYQHLATRMVEPHKELRTWRAWACWYLAKELLPEADYPHDAVQVRVEKIVKPTRAQIAAQLARWSPSDDLAAWEGALALAHGWMNKSPSPPPPSLSFRIIGPEELPTVRILAYEIWQAAYPGIISTEQIHYMLERMYAEDEMRQEIVVRGVRYALIESAGGSLGYMAWEFVPNDRSCFLHKLYVKTGLHGRGVGAASLQWLEEQAGHEGATFLRLRVNRQNHRAIRAYLRAGFSFGHDLCSDIGGGFVMDDHVMFKALSA